MSRDLKLSGGIALCAHIGALFLTGAVFTSKAIFDIERAPSSIEVFLVEKIEESKPRESEEVKFKKKVPQEIKLNNTPYDAITSASPVKRDATPPLEKNIATFAEQGAITKAMPNYLKNRPPAYPRLARQLGYEGTVILNVEVSSEGRCANMQIMKSSGYSILDNTAMKAVKQWTFKPASILNRPVASHVEIPITFKLKNLGSAEIFSGY